MMSMLFVGIGIVLSLFVLGLVSLRTGESEGRIIDSEWMDEAEKFHFISRWGA